MVERSEDLELFDLRTVEELLDRTVGHQGHGRLRKAVALYTPSSFTRSGLEKRFLELCREAGLPRAAFERDRKRQEDLLLAGIGMTRVTGPRLEREPREVVRRVARLLELRGLRAA